VEAQKSRTIPLTHTTDFVAAMGEFVGTTMFLFFAFAGTQVANVGGQNKDSSTTGGETGFSPEVLLYIALVFGFSLMVNVWVFFRISGGLFNPAVSFAVPYLRVQLGRLIVLSR
jgi:aquaporin related protein